MEITAPVRSTGDCLSPIPAGNYMAAFRLRFAYCIITNRYLPLSNLGLFKLCVSRVSFSILDRKHYSSFRYVAK